MSIGNFWVAFRYCMGQTQQLASDESTQDSKMLAKLLTDNSKTIMGRNVWLGATDAGKRNSWIWLSELRPVGGLTKYTRWKDNEPSSITGKNMCMVAVLDNDEVKWKAQDCETSNCYVCQKYLTNRTTFRQLGTTGE
ncbi:AAEL011609-PA [Aedes aegypti]|uniref:AAEL011609-PA n=1 Tax=Aedes aegypti TaxID=7159 RepID=Q16PK0_AEDAE|nr:AAEL011609-PA [Aedes aegypti]